MTSDVIAARPGLPRPIQRGALVEAVAAHRSWRGVMRTLGLTTSRTGRVLRTICDELQIDYSHFRQSRVDLRPLADVVRDCETWDEVLGKLGYAPGSGSARATIRKHCRRLGIDTSLLRVTNPPPLRWAALVADQRNLRIAGPHIVAAALASVGIPSSAAPEGLAYDLLADLPAAGIARLQVKTTTRRVGETWECQLTRTNYSGESRSSHRKAVYSAEEVDFFACVDPRASVYLIPIGLVEGLTTIALRRYEGYRVPALWSCGECFDRADMVPGQDLGIGALTSFA